MSTRKNRRPILERFPNLQVTGYSTQAYDPEMVTIDEVGTAISRERQRLGFGAPPIVAYGQTLPNFGFRTKLTQTFPMLKKWLPARSTRR